jgi:hypothetical protein
LILSIIFDILVFTVPEIENVREREREQGESKERARESVKERDKM